MIIRNLDVESDWSNGALAEVTNMRNGVIELIHLDNRTNKVVGKFQSMFQAPTTVEAQGLTLPIVAIYFDNMPSHSELYVAMSRVRRADKLYFFGVDAGDVEERFQLYLNGDAIEIMETLS
ncbi:unnamed protein product [Mucor circinelloides]